jgi:hypothetical protein
MTLILSNQDYNSTSRIINLPAPAGATEPVRLQDLNSAIEGLAWKDSVRVAPLTNTTIAAPGATIDGVTMLAGDRVLLLAQTLPAENGIYVWNGAAALMTRSLDANSSDELEEATTMVEEGASNTGVSYRQASVNFLLGTAAVIWVPFGSNTPLSSIATPGTIRTATQTEADAGTVANAAITPATLSNYASRIKKFTATIGDGTATVFPLTHNLNSLDVVISVYRVSTGAEVIVDTARTSVNAVSVSFTTAPAVGAYRIVVVG